MINITCKLSCIIIMNSFYRYNHFNIILFINDLFNISMTKYTGKLTIHISESFPIFFLSIIHLSSYNGQQFSNILTI